LVGLEDGESSATETEDFSVTSTEELTYTEQQPSEQQQEYIDSGNQLAGYIEDYLNPHPHVRILEHRAHANNTIDIAVQTDGAVPLEQAVMDSVQASSAAIYYGTMDDPTRWKNGSLRFFHEPDRVRVYLRGPDRQPLGTFAIDGNEAYRYRNHTIKTPEFAEGVMDTYEVYNSYQRGNKHPSWYLNHSELTIWLTTYRDETQRYWYEAGEEDDSPFPLDNIRVNESKHEILHSMEWDRSVYDYLYLDARATIIRGYWLTTEDSYAMPPERLNYHIVLPENSDADRAGYMEREEVYRFLETNRGRPALVDYAESVQTFQIDNGTEPPFEGF
jgi:hypothetical protein